MGKHRHHREIQRFPRTPEQYPEAAYNVGLMPHMGKTARLKMQLAHGYVPRGYDRLSKKQRKVANRIASGISVEDACHLTNVKTESFYRWINLHPLFKKYFAKMALHYAERVESRLDGKLPRAVTILENSMESKDPYFAHDAAVTLLKGRGKLKTSVQNKSEIVAEHHISGNVKHEHVDEKLALAFVDAMVRMSQGGTLKPLKPKVIDVKSLPPATIEVLSGTRPEVQEDKQRATVGKNKPS